jgi:hypothetical protein
MLRPDDGGASAGARLHRNMLVFLAPDRTLLTGLRQGVREYLAWKSIEADRETLNLEAFQTKMAETKREQLDDVVTQRIARPSLGCSYHLKPASDPNVAWDETRVGGPEPLAERVSKNCATRKR